MQDNKIEYFSFKNRELDKKISRLKDEMDLFSGRVSPMEMSKKNGGGLRKIRYIGLSHRIQKLSEKY